MDTEELEKVYIGHPSGSRACIHLHGAHLTSWTTANGHEQIFLSKKAVFKPPKVSTKAKYSTSFLLPSLIPKALKIYLLLKRKDVVTNKKTY